jgi:hypothetical protein
MGLSLDVNGLIDGVSVQLLNIAGRSIATQTADAGGDAAFRNLLPAGIYYVKVTPTGTLGTDYAMSLSTVTPPLDRAGNTLARARYLGVMTARTNFSISDSVNPFDTADYYRMLAPKGLNVSLQLSGLTDGVSVDLLDAKGHVVQTLTADNTGVATFNTTTTVAAWYFLRLASTNPDTAAGYTLHLGATAAAKPAPPAMQMAAGATTTLANPFADEKVVQSLGL